MLTMTFTPRFSETDALGHINNTVIPIWFESARKPVFEIFNPELNLQQWNLIIAKIEVNYLAQMNYQTDFKVTTQISRLGNSSFNVLQQVFDSETKVAWGECTMVKFDYNQAKSVQLSEQEREALTSLLV